MGGVYLNQMQLQSRGERLKACLQLIVLLSWLLLPFPSHAVEVDEIPLSQAQMVFGTVTHIGNRDMEIAVRPAYSGENLIGYLFLTSEIAPIPAYSGKPVSVLIGLDLAARIEGIMIVEHEEPILVIGVTDQHLAAFTRQYRGQSAQSKVRVGAHNREGYVGIDGISGATITAMVMNRSIMRSAQWVSAHYGLPRVVGDVKPAISTGEKVSGIPVAKQEAGEQPAVQLAGGGTKQVSQPQQTVYQEQWFDLQLVWQEKGVQLIIIVLALGALISILFFQDWLVRRTKLFRTIRLLYLIFTVFYIGYYCMAQLSIMNVLAFFQLLVNQFTWETLMIDPLIFVIWGFVAISIILWGRGVYCGWLCPFGAMQELIHKFGNHIGLKSYEFPQMVHERLWAIKYIVLILLVGVSLESLATASLIAEIEPFKTTLSLRFQREWWFVAYALLLLIISAFNSKFFCKYLCPLGAGLSFATRFRVFDWLRRKKECGRPCQTCASQCQISAIKHTGEIIDTECHYCLECQVGYWDDHLCPPLIEKRKKRERRKKRSKQQIALKTID